MYNDQLTWTKKNYFSKLAIVNKFYGKLQQKSKTLEENKSRIQYKKCTEYYYYYY